MTILYKAAGWGTIFAILALVVTLLKQIIAFIGFLTFAIKILVVLAFVMLIVGVGLMIIRGWNANRQTKQ
jgi:multisubunit Na+/H+ antiporter MnhG subunit